MCSTPACFSTFYWSTMVLTLCKFLIFILRSLLWMHHIDWWTQAFNIKRKVWCHMPQLYQISSEKWNIHYHSLSAIANPLHSSKIQELFEKYLCNQSSPYENYGWFLLHKGSHHVLPPKLTFFVVSKDEWNTKEDTGKSMKNALYVLQYAKSTSWTEVV